MKKKLILIGGSTGVGKTKLSLRCKDEFDGYLISCDSMQIYKDMDIGTAKITKKEQELYPHALIDVVCPNEEFSVSDYVNLAKREIEKAYQQNKVPILVGGTGLYMKSLLFPYSFSSTVKNEKIREYYKNLANENGNEFVYEILKQKNPKRASLLHPNDVKRVIRSLEIIDTIGEFKQDELVSEYDYKLIVLNCDRKVLYDRINKRVDEMFDEGLLDEVKNVIKKYNLTKEHQSMKAIGYSEFFDYFEGHKTLDLVKEKIKQDSRNYAKRQITWFKAMPKAKFMSIDNIDEIIKELKIFLNGIVIAVDGPSASGKTTICDKLAKRLDINHLSSGALYRAITLFCKQNSIDVNLFVNNNKAEIQKILKQINIKVEFEDFIQKIFLNNIDVTNLLNTNEISNMVCFVSQNLMVREFVRKIQTDLAQKGNIIIDGRDITSIVLKDCKNKFFITASVQERARRRYEQYNKQIPIDKIERDIQNRDKIDQNRELAPLKIVEDAVVIDSSNLTIEETVDEIIKNLKLD